MDSNLPEAEPGPGHEPTKKLLFLLALGAGLGVANVYYLQPALQLIQLNLKISTTQAGLIPTLTQVGYAAGMFFLAPLGDTLPRRTLIIVKALLLSLALVLAGLAPNLQTLIFACIAIGLLSSIGQDFVPVAAQLSPELNRGQVVGIVTTGLLTGILLSRTLGGIVSEQYGWRSMQFIAAGLMLVVALMVRRGLPQLDAINPGTPYSALIRSLSRLWSEHRSLKLSIVTQALLASTLGAFWSTLAMVIAGPPYNQSAAIAGAFGIAGAAGACGAAIFGRLADTKGPLPAIRTGCLLVTISFTGMWLLPKSLLVLAVGTLLFDLGIMAALVSHQFVINSIDAQSRGRLNGLLMTGAMCGMAVGAAAGSVVWANSGWAGICILCISTSILSLFLSFFHHPHKNGVNTYE